MNNKINITAEQEEIKTNKNSTQGDRYEMEEEEKK
jgi:hypothetical protein